LVHFFDPDEDNDGNPNDPTDYWPGWPTGVFNNVPALDATAASTSDDNKEAYADADGDGILDSVWLYQKGFFDEDPNPSTYKYTRVTYADPDNNGHHFGLVTDLPIKSGNADLTYRMAVRIVDTSGMVNVNTAWQVPNDLPAMVSTSEDQLNQFLGNTLSGVNLYGCKGDSGSTSGTYTYDDFLGYTGTALPGKTTANATLKNLIKFQDNYILKIENPVWGSTGLNVSSSSSPFYSFSPMDQSDELELRYKWVSPGLGYTTGSLKTGSKSTLETYFPELDGDITSSGTADGKITDTNSDGVFDSSDAAYANLQKRALLTAYSFSRNIRTTNMDAAETVAQFDGRMKNINEVIYALVYRIKDGAFPGERPTEQADVQRFVHFIYNAFEADETAAHYADNYASTTPADQEDYATYHTWQYIANLVDYLDDDDVPTDIDTSATATDSTLRTDLGLGTVEAAISFKNDSHVFGLEKHTVISEVMVTCETYTKAEYAEDGEGNITKQSPTTAKYNVAVEIHNLWNEKTKSPAAIRYYYVTDDPNNLGRHEFIPCAAMTGEMNVGGYSQASINGSTITLSTNPTAKTVNSETGASETNETYYNISFIIVTYAKNAANQEIPEDIFVIPLNSDVPDTTNGTSRSFERNGGTPWSLMVNTPVARVDDEGNALWNENNTLSGANHASSTVACCGYATVTTANTTSNPLADVWCDSAVKDLWQLETAAGWGNFAKIRNWGDLLSVPYVGYCRDANGMYRGIGDWLDSNDNTLRFDVTSTNTNEKGYVLRGELLDRYTVLNREDDGINQLTGTTADTIDEMRLPGLININTASEDVLNALHPLSAIASGAISTATKKPYTSISDLISRQGLNAANLLYLGMTLTDDVNILNLSTTSSDFDLLQKEGLFTRFANLITTRSDTFCAYIYVQALDKDGNVVASHREMALFDRSLCNKPPLIWNSDPNNDGNTTDACWQTNPAYRPVKVVSRQVVE
jgi:hypothetical protein